MLAQLERAEAELAAYGAGDAGTVTVAAFATGIGLVLAPAIAELTLTAPGIRVRVQDAEGDASVPMVLDRQVDVAVAVEYRGAPGEDDRRLTRVPLYSEPFDAVLPVGHRLAYQDQVAIADLEKDPWIGPYPGNPCHDVVVLSCEFMRLPAETGALLGRLPRGGGTRRSGGRGGTGAEVGAAGDGTRGGGGTPGGGQRTDPAGVRRGTAGGGGASPDPSGARRVAGGGGAGAVDILQPVRRLRTQRPPAAHRTLTAS